MVIAVDFDGTLVENCDYPFARNPIMKNIQYVKKMKSEGHKIILWTCREKESLEHAIKFCNDYGIELDAVNENVDIEDKIRDFGYNSRKVYADIYLDDKSVILS